MLIVSASEKDRHAMVELLGQNNLPYQDLPSSLDNFYLATQQEKLVGIIGAVDWVTGFELSFFVFYLIPVALAAGRFAHSWGAKLSSSSALPRCPSAAHFIR